jgi:hypothetical protein
LALVVESLLTLLIVAMLVVFTVGTLSFWQCNGPLIYDPFFPLPWTNAMGYSPWSAEVIEARMLLAILLALVALHFLFVALTAQFREPLVSLTAMTAKLTATRTDSST